MRGALLALLLASCAADGTSAVTSYAIVQPDQTPPPAWLVFDGQVLVARGQVGGEAGVLVKANGIPLAGPVITVPGQVLCYRVDPEERVELEVGAPLPAWAASAFAVGQAERFGVTFED